MKTIPPALLTLLEAGALGPLSDGSLLERFVAGRDESAFEALLQRHGPMVWGVCLRILRDSHDAEDAFQATFLVLARKAATLERREMFAGWLHGVARQTARKARAMRAKRKAREKSLVIERADLATVPRGSWDDLLPSLDRELGRLPSKYRIPIVLCDLEGKTHKEASRELGWPIGTVSGRLSRARAMLARRLSRQGPAVTAGALGLLLSEQAVTSCPPVELTRATARIATLLATGRAVSTVGISAAVASLTRGVLKTMLISKIGSTTAGVILVVALSTGLVASYSSAQPTSPAPSDRPQQSQKAGESRAMRDRWQAARKAQLRETRDSVEATMLHLRSLRDTLMRELSQLEEEYLTLRKEGVAAGDPREVGLRKRLTTLKTDHNSVLDAMKRLQLVLDRVLSP